MAAYAATVTLATRLPTKILVAPGLGVLFGSVDITNYNSTLAELTGITGFFKSAVTLVCSGVSTLGYLVAWDVAGKALKAFTPTAASATHTHVLHFQTSAAANAVTAAANQLRTAAAAFDVAGVANSAGEGGVVAAAAFAAAAGTEAANDTNVGVVQFIALGIIGF